MIRNRHDLVCLAQFWAERRREQQRREWATLARWMLLAHLDVLPGRWPPGAPGDYIADVEIGECSALDHCDDIAQWLVGRGLEPDRLLAQVRARSWSVRPAARAGVRVGPRIRTRARTSVRAEQAQAQERPR